MKKLDAKLVYWISIFFEGMIFSIVLAATQLYRVQTVGLNPLQLVLVGTTIEITVFIFEIPTGIVADVYSRRASVIIGTFLLGIGFLVEASIPLFGIVISAQVILGVAWTFISGAHSAWIADEVGVENVGQVYLRSTQYRRIGSLLGIPLFVLLGNVSYRLPIAVGGALFLCVALFRLLTMPEDGFQTTLNEERDTWNEMVATLKGGIQLARLKPVLMTFAVIAIFVGLYSEGYDRLTEAHFIGQFNFPLLPWGGDPFVSWFALMRVMGIFLGLGATELARRRLDTSDNLKVARALQGIYGLISLGLLGFAWSTNFYWALLATLVVDTARGVTVPLIDTWINKHIESKVRATMLSMTAQLDAFGQMFGGPIVGLVGNLRSIRAALTASAMLIIPVVPLYGRTIRQAKKNDQ
ncbi:MAG: MFS transporter [Anaerolineales bacterium]|nr:MFS transporter [Chloroflexota bacterium]MBL6979990.1 MFS transporter [Anaerolineales bacterium]